MAVCANILAFIGLADMGKSWTNLLIPWMALDIVLAVLMLIRFFSGIASGRSASSVDTKISKPKPKKHSKPCPQTAGLPDLFRFRPPIGRLLVPSQKDQH
jgi:hypothetical protein